MHDLIVALKIVTPNSDNSAASSEENKENILKTDTVDNGNNDSKTTSTSEVPMEVEGSGENKNESDQQQTQPNTSSHRYAELRIIFPALMLSNLTRFW